MKKNIVLIIICVVVIISKYVISSGYYDYVLQEKELKILQLELIDTNKRAIAELEDYRSANYLFSQKEVLELQELTPDNTIILYNSELSFQQGRIDETEE